MSCKCCSGCCCAVYGASYIQRSVIAQANRLGSVVPCVTKAYCEDTLGGTWHPFATCKACGALDRSIATVNSWYDPAEDIYRPISFTVQVSGMTLNYTTGGLNYVTRVEDVTHPCGQLEISRKLEANVTFRTLCLNGPSLLAINIQVNLKYIFGAGLIKDMYRDISYQNYDGAGLIHYQTGRCDQTNSSNICDPACWDADLVEDATYSINLAP